MAGSRRGVALFQNFNLVDELYAWVPLAGMTGRQYARVYEFNFSIAEFDTRLISNHF